MAGFHNRYAISVLPAILLVALVLVERGGAYLLGLHPSSEWLWWMVLTVRAQFGNFYSMAYVLNDLHIAFQLLALMAGLAVLTKIALTPSIRMQFIVAHAALLGLVFLSLDPSRESSALRLVSSSGEVYAQAVAFAPSAFHLTLTALTLACCAAAHLTILQTGARQSQQRIMLTRLALD